MDIGNFLFFATLADAESLSDAARRLGIDRSGVSRRLKELEAQANAQLVVRDTRNMALTTLGVAFYAQCVAVRDQVAQAHSVLNSQAGMVHGPLRVSAPPAVTRTLLASMFEDFCRRYPAVLLNLRLQAGPVDLIDQQIDVAIRFTNTPEASYVARPIAHTEWLLCASPGFLANCGPIETPEDLGRQPWLGIRGRMEVTLVGTSGAHRMLCVSRMSCADYVLLRDFCSNGLGVAMLPAYIASPLLRSAHLIRVLPHLSIDPTPGSTLYAITLQSRYMPPQVTAFVAYLKERMGRQAWDGLVSSAQDH